MRNERGWARLRAPLAHFRHQRALLEFALASLLRHRGKAAVLCATLTLVVFVLTSLAFLRSSVRLEAATVLRDAPDLIVQRLVAGRQELIPEAALAAVRAIPGVSRAQGRLWGYHYDPASGANYTLVVPLVNPPAQGETAIGAGIARSRQGYSRDVLAFKSYRGGPILFTVKAVLPDRADLIAADLMLVSEPDFRDLFALPTGVVNDIVVYVTPGADADAVRRELLRGEPTARVISRQDLLATADSLLDWRRGLVAAVALAMTLALLIVALDKPSSLGIEEQQELGILRAVGWSKTDLLVAKVWESLAGSITALLVGILAAYAHVYGFGAALFVPVLRGWGVLSPALHLVPAIDLATIGLIAASTVLLPAGGALLACYGSAVAEPDAVMRG